MAATDVAGEREERRIALEDPSGLWELWDGRLVGKPPMSVTHDRARHRLAAILLRRLPEDTCRVRLDSPRLRRSSRRYVLPDVTVVPTAPEDALLETPTALDAYAEPMPLVVEVWSPSTGMTTSRRSSGSIGSAATWRSGASTPSSGR